MVLGILPVVVQVVAIMVEIQAHLQAALAVVALDLMVAIQHLITQDNLQMEP